MSSLIDPPYHLTQYYIFREISKFSGQPYFIQVDLDRELRELRSQFDQIELKRSRYWAEKKIWRIWKRLKEVHTEYFLPKILGSFSYFHPISVVSELLVDQNNEQIMKIKYNEATRGMFDEYNHVYFNNSTTIIDFEKYEGWRIMKIDGMDALEFLIEFSKRESYSARDYSTNFNLLQLQQSELIWPIVWYFRGSQEFDDPSGPVIYEVTNGSVTETLTVDFLTCFWGVKSCKNISNSKELKKFIDQGSDYEVTTEEEEKERLQRIYSSIYGEENYVIPIYVSECHEFLVGGLTDPPTGVMSVLAESSLCKGESKTDLTRYIDNLVTAFGKLKNAGFDRFILDLRFNKGGYCQLSFLIASALTKTTFPEVKNMYGSWIWTLETLNEYQNPKFGWFENLKESTPMSFFKDHINHVMAFPNGKEIEFSPLETYDLSSFNRDIKKETGFQGFEPENLLTLTTGQSESAGGHFIRFLQFTKSSKIIGLGGIEGVDMDTATVCNGWKEFFKIGNYLNLNMAFGAIFNSDPRYSLYDKSKQNVLSFNEFKKFPPDFRHYDWNNLYQEYSESFFIDLQVFFHQCLDWNVVINETCDCIDKALCGNPCIHGTYSDEICVIKRCEEGYYLNEMRTKCLEISKAPLFSVFDEEQEISKKSSTANIALIIATSVLGILLIVETCIIGLLVPFLIIFPVAIGVYYHKKSHSQYVSLINQ